MAGAISEPERLPNSGLSHARQRTRSRCGARNPYPAALSAMPTETDELARILATRTAKQRMHKHRKGVAWEGILGRGCRGNGRVGQFTAAVLQHSGTDRASFQPRAIDERGSRRRCNHRRARGYALHQYNSSRGGRSGRRGTAISSTIVSARSSAGTRWRWWCAPTSFIRAGRTHLELRLGSHLYDVGFNHFWHAPSEQPWRRPRFFSGSFFARHLRARVPRRAHQRRAAHQFPARGRRQRAVFLSASLADADFWQFPPSRWAWGRSWRSTRRVSCKYLQDRGIARHRRPQGVGFHGRRRDGRARIARRDRPGGARATGQSDLRRQLQSAAPGWPGARQRQNHSGAGS